jgi:hypothetical protein
MSIGYVADMAIIPAQAPAPRRKSGVSSAFSVVPGKTKITTGLYFGKHMSLLLKQQRDVLLYYCI